ncbi:hypothetical protein E8E14_015010 [Neopestalotiopsis sp. 37M]|nr:hypothetical protein E8E14_015010 [Neopestalotiopsis sp. 37M]
MANNFGQMAMGAYDDIPIVHPTDVYLLDNKPVGHPVAYGAACREGRVDIVQSLVAAEAHCTPAFLHHGLTVALASGQVAVATYLLSAGAPIARQTPYCILGASSSDSEKIALFELLTEHGWTPNTPGFYGVVLLPEIIRTESHALLAWFLAHGADPNLGPQRDFCDRLGGPETNSCAALEAAARRGDESAVRHLLAAGALVTNGAPLHSAAGARPPPPDWDLRAADGPVTPAFDEKMIPTMALLVAHGADVNARQVSRHMIPGLAIVEAVMAGAVQRVKWLLDHGADPEARGAWGSAVSYADKVGSQEMKDVLAEGRRARRWISGDSRESSTVEVEQVMSDHTPGR